MARHIILTIYDPAEPQRVVVFRRADGTFGFEHQRFAEPEECWIPAGKYSEAICDTLQTAERDARNRVPWLRVAPPPPALPEPPRSPTRYVALREISADPASGLRIALDVPPATNYEYIYRAALSVRWDGRQRALYMLPRADRAPLEACQRICEALLSEYGEALVLTPDTAWRDLTPADRAAIQAWLADAAK